MYEDITWEGGTQIWKTAVQIGGEAQQRASHRDRREQTPVLLIFQLQATGS